MELTICLGGSGEYGSNLLLGHGSRKAQPRRLVDAFVELPVSTYNHCSHGLCYASSLKFPICVFFPYSFNVKLWSANVFLEKYEIPGMCDVGRGRIITARVRQYEVLFNIWVC